MSANSSSRVRPARVALVAAAVVAALLALPAASWATMPGLNGRIAFNQLVPDGEGDELAGIWSMNADGSGAGRLSALNGSEAASYSPDGSRIAFEHEEQIWVAAADGSGARLLVGNGNHTTTTTRWEQNVENPETGQTFPWARIEERREVTDGKFGPKFSPTGSALLVEHYTGTFIENFVCEVPGDEDDDCDFSKEPFYEEECADCGSSVETIDANTGTPLATLVPRVSRVIDFLPTYSSTGAIAFDQREEGDDTRKIVVIPSPGAPPITVASSDNFAGEPDFSPDGTRLAYVLNDHTVAIVPAAGGGPTTVDLPNPSAAASRWYAYLPIWSPDGTRIAVGDIPQDGEQAQGGVYVMAPDGSAMTRIRGEGSVPTSWQPIPRPPAPPAVRARAVKGKKKLKLNKKGAVAVGKVVCGSSPCALKASGAKLKLGKKKYGVKATFAKTLAPGASAQVSVKVKGKALTALKAKHAGKLTLTVAVADAAGSESLSFAPKLLAPAAKGGKRK